MNTLKAIGIIILLAAAIAWTYFYTSNNLEGKRYASKESILGAYVEALEERSKEKMLALSDEDQSPEKIADAKLTKSEGISFKKYSAKYEGTENPNFGSFTITNDAGTFEDVIYVTKSGDRWYLVLGTVRR